MPGAHAVVAQGTRAWVCRQGGPAVREGEGARQTRVPCALHAPSMSHARAPRALLTVSWVSCCARDRMSGLIAGLVIGIVGDAGVRAVAQQPRMYVGMVLILIFAEALGLYGLIVALILASQVSNDCLPAGLPAAAPDLQADLLLQPVGSG